MATQRPDDHLNRRIPQSQEEGTFDEDLHRTLDLTIRQVNRLEEDLTSLETGGGGEVGSVPDGLEERVEDLETGFDLLGGRVDDLADRVDRIEFQARDEVFLQPIELRAPKSEIFGAAGGTHTVEFAPPEVSFEPKGQESYPLSVHRKRVGFGEIARFEGDGPRRHADLWASGNGNLQIAPKRPDETVQGPAPADVVAEADQILPKEPYETSLGSNRRKFLSLHVAELWVEQLVAQNKIATIGGDIFVGPTTELTAGLSGDPGDAAVEPAGDYYNYIRVKHNQMSPGDVVMLENFTRAEFLRVEEGPVQIEAENKEEGGDDNPFDFVRDFNYRYRVERDLDGSGANNWGEGAAVANTGRKRSGFLDLYSERSRRAENESGPTMAISIREEDKSSYGRGVWGTGVQYYDGDIVYWDSTDWSLEKEYKEGDVVLSPRRPEDPDWELEDRKFYVADRDHESEAYHSPMRDSFFWSLWADPSRWKIDTDYEIGDIVYVEGEDGSGNKTLTYFSARENHTSSRSDEPLSESQKWGNFHAPVWELWADPDPWQSGKKYKFGDLVSFEEQDSDGNTVVRHYYAEQEHTSELSDTPLSGSANWTRFYGPIVDSNRYETGDIVWYEPREQHYIAQTGHNPSESDEPLASSDKWERKDLPADTNFAAQSDHESAKSDLPLSESGKWTEVGVTDYFNQWGERAGIGNLEGLYDYNYDLYGVAGGDPKQTWFSIDETQGFRIHQGGKKTGHWDADGVLSLGYQEDSWIRLDPDIGMKMKEGELTNSQWRVGGGIRVGRPLLTTCEPQRWRGPWQAGTDYMMGDIAQSPSDGLFYIATADHTSGSGDSPISGSGKWVPEQYPVEIALNGEMILRGTLRIPDGRWCGLPK